jgi:hypothetical protein
LGLENVWGRGCRFLQIYLGGRSPAILRDSSTFALLFDFCNLDSHRRRPPASHDQQPYYQRL